MRINRENHLLPTPLQGQLQGQEEGVWPLFLSSWLTCLLYTRKALSLQAPFGSDFPLQSPWSSTPSLIWAQWRISWLLGRGFLWLLIMQFPKCLSKVLGLCPEAVWNWHTNTGMYAEPVLPLICSLIGPDVLYLDSWANTGDKEDDSRRRGKQESQAAITLARFLHNSTTILRKPAAAA